jgi:hypothetical protein
MFAKFRKSRAFVVKLDGDAILGLAYLRDRRRCVVIDVSAREQLTS